MHLVIGPGAMAVYGFLGALSAVGLQDIEEVSGSSAGAVLGLLVCTGKTIDEIRDIVFGVEWKELTKLNIVSFIKKFGLIPYAPIKAKLIELCGGNLTFKDLPKKLHVTSFCMNRNVTEYFSVDNAPDMSVIDAVYMSMSIPFLFETLKLNTFTYIDGSAREIVPSLAFLNKDPKDVLIIQKERHKSHFDEITNIKEFLICIASIAVDNCLDCGSFPNRIRVDFGDANLINFEMEYDEKIKLYLRGYQTALIHLGSFK
jgi:predicted acylesterase/phospholipase RssA